MMKFCAAETSCGFFGSGGFIVYEIREGQDGFEVYELLPMVLIGVIGGLAGATFNHLNAKLARLRKLLLLTYGPKGRVFEGVVVAALTSTVSFVLPMLVACVVRGVGQEGGGRAVREGVRGRCMHHTLDTCQSLVSPTQPVMACA
jgi:chloride channel 7